MGHRCAAAGLLVVTFLLLAAPTASACVTDDWLTVEAATGAGPGTRIPVEGGGFEPRAVELRWNGMSGEILGVAEAGADGRFVATVVVPEVAVAGRYSVVAVQQPEGGTRGWAYADVVLTAPTPALEPVASAPSAGRGPWPYVVAILLVGTVTGLILAARRRKAAAWARLDAELHGLVDDERTPAASGRRG